ncbi:MAG TPA: VWA domain-containing protein [Blastocatellia bacterium]|nr:VWA domain-containing protein [Blastocatellia bacterium]
MSNTVCLLILTIVLQTITPGRPQSQTNRSEQDRPLRLRTDLIEIRAVVTDRQGKVVDDLKKEDFEVLENGREQQVAFFSLEKLAVQPAATPMPTTAGGPGRDLIRPAPASAPKRTIVFFVDTLHLSNENYLRSRQMLRTFIDQQIRADDLVAVISSGGPMGLFNQFTQNRGVLLNAVEKLRPWGIRRTMFAPYIAYLVVLGDRGATSAAIDIVSQEEGFPVDETYIQGLARSILSEAARWRNASLNTLEAAMDRMATMPGQRLVFLLSDGFSLQDNAGNAHGDLNRVTSRAVRSGILVYSIDAKGLETDLMISDASSRVVIRPSIYKYISDSHKDEQDAINAIGKDTGGDAFFNNNDMAFVMKQALDSNSVYYALGYYPSDQKNDNGYRRLTVRVKNHPEYKVRTQKGYQPPDRKKEEEIARHTPQQKMLDAIAAPLPQTEIGVTASAYYLERDLDESQVSIEVFIDGTTLEYGKQDGHQAIDCDVTTVIFDQTGKSTRVITDKVQGSLTPERLEEGKKNGYRYVKRLELKPGIYQARIGVRENGSERIGTANTFVEVPNLDRAKLAVSSVVLTRLGNPSEGRSQGTDAPELFMPRVRQGIPYFSQGTSMAYQLTVYENVARKPEDSGLMIQSELTQGEQSIYRSQWQPVAERLVRLGKKGFDAGGQINLDLKPGLYELRVTVKDPKSNRSAQQSVLFEVEA